MGGRGERRKLPFLRILGAVRAEMVEVGITTAVIWKRCVVVLIFYLKVQKVGPTRISRDH